MMKNEKQLMVSVVMITYGHENYIEQAIKGVLMQECDFQYELIIANDCSPDNTDRIVQKIIDNTNNADRIKYVRHTVNKGMTANFLWTLQQASGKYIAICEGDDYWTDPLKLQKQVDLLEVNRGVVAVITNSSVSDFKGNILEKERMVIPPDNIEGEYDLHSFFRNGHQYPTLTVLFRNTEMDKLIEDMSLLKNDFLGDWTLWVILHARGNFYFLNNVTGNYRLNPTSVTHTANRVARWKADFQIRKQVMDYLPKEYHKYLRNNWYAYFQIGMSYRKNKNYIKMFFYFLLSFLSSPVKFINRLKQ